MKAFLLTGLLAVLVAAGPPTRVPRARTAPAEIPTALAYEVATEDAQACQLYGRILANPRAANRVEAACGRARLLFQLGAPSEGKRLLDSLAHALPPSRRLLPVAALQAEAALSAKRPAAALRAARQVAKYLKQQPQPTELIAHPDYAVAAAQLVARAYSLIIPMDPTGGTAADSAEHYCRIGLHLIRRYPIPMGAELAPASAARFYSILARAYSARARVDVAQGYYDSALVTAAQQREPPSRAARLIWSSRGSDRLMGLNTATTAAAQQRIASQVETYLARAQELETLPREQARMLALRGEMQRVLDHPLVALTHFSDAIQLLRTALALPTTARGDSLLLQRGAHWPELRYLYEQQAIVALEVYEQTHSARYLEQYYYSATSVASLLDAQRRLAALGTSNVPDLDPLTTLDTYALAVEAGETLFRRTGQARYLTRAFAVAENAKAYRLLTRVRAERDPRLRSLAPAQRQAYGRIVTSARRWQELSALASSVPALRADPLVRVAVDSARQAQARLLAARTRSSGPQRALDEPMTLTPAQVSQSLPADGSVAAVEYLRRTSYEDGLNRELLYAFVIQRTGTRLLRLELPDTFVEAIDSLAAVLAQPSRPGYTALAARLYGQVLAPVAQVLAPSVRRLLISPDGELWQVPFEALLTQPVVTTSGVDFRRLPYALRRWHFSYAHSLTLHTQPVEPPGSASRAATGLLALAPFADTSLTDARALPYTAELLRDLRRTTPGTYLEGAAATPAAFRRYAPTCQVLHVATHARADLENPLDSRLLLAPDRPGGPDAALTLTELYRMPMHPRLVVLSACQTGVGKQAGASESLSSLSWAFSYAGAAAVVATLWRVDDRATAQLLDRFYAGLRHVDSAESALHNAKITYLAQAATPDAGHPFYWAGLVLTGDEGPVALTAPAGSWSVQWLAIGAGLIGLLALGGWWWRRRKTTRALAA